LLIKEQTSSFEHFDYAITLNNIGLVNKGQGKYDEALKFFTKSIEKTPLNHPYLAITLNNIG